MARTITQIETDIKNKQYLMMLEYLKDYFVKMNNLNMDKINAILQDVYNHVNGIDTVIGHLGKPLDPAATDPASPNDYDWYFNTTSKDFKMYHNGGWTVIAHLADTVDLTGYYTKTEVDTELNKKANTGDSYTKSESDTKYELKGQGGTANEYTSAKELYDAIESSTPINNADTKVVNADTADEIIRNQKEINFKFLSEFSDDVYYKSDKVMEYKDRDLGLVTLDAAIATAGNSISYTSLISPYDRIYQDQASFEATLGVNGQSIEYRFTGKGKAIKFSGNAGQKYKWQTVTKFSATGTRELYIRFTGNVTMSTSNDAFNPSPTWTNVSLPTDVKLSDFMDENNRTALVQMTFVTIPATGTKVASIDYKTASHFYDQRQVTLEKAQVAANTAVANEIETRVNAKITANKNSITNNTNKINALSGGVKVYHFSSKFAADQAVLDDSTNGTYIYHDGAIAWIGDSGDWVGYHLAGGSWVVNGTTSSHATTVDAYTKTEADAKFEMKKRDYKIASFTHQPNLLIGAAPSDLGTLKDGDLLRLDLAEIDSYLTGGGQEPEGNAQLFIGTSLAVRIPNSSGSAAMKWTLKTNATDTNVKDNYQSKYLIVQYKVDDSGVIIIGQPPSAQLNFVSWEDKALDITQEQLDTLKHFRGIQNGSPFDPKEGDWYIRSFPYAILRYHGGGWETVVEKASKTLRVVFSDDSHEDFGVV